MSFRLELPQFFAADDKSREILAYLIRTVNMINYAFGFLDVPEPAGGAEIRAEDPNNKSLIISAQSTNTQYPSAKAVYEYAVPQTRTVNGHALDADVDLTAEDVSAVPTSRTVNGHALTEDLTLTAEDVDAAPVTREINGHALTEDVDLTMDDMGAGDYVTQTGTEGNWVWRKWKSGMVEQWNHNIGVAFSAGTAFTTDLYFAYGSFETPVAIDYSTCSVFATPLNPADSMICGGAATPTGMMVAAVRKTAAAGSLALQLYVRGTEAGT